MIPFFPVKLAKKALITYVAALVVVSLLYLNYAIGFFYMVLGLGSVAGFFFGASKLTRQYSRAGSQDFARHLFWTALTVRIVWVVFAYFFFKSQTGRPFEWSCGDSLFYHQEACDICTMRLSEIFSYFGRSEEVSDVGYPLYLTLLYKIFGPNIFIIRIIKCLIGAYTCMIVYRLASRSFGEDVGRMSAVFFCLMPNLIYYCGMHLKETELLCLTMLFLDKADGLLRSGKLTFKNILVVCLLMLSLFFFRTVLGIVAFLALCCGMFLSPDSVVDKYKRFGLISVGAVFCVFTLSTSISGDINYIWENKTTNQEQMRLQQESRGNRWAKYATGAVMAPMIFVVPFSTMVDTGQYEQQVLSGGNFVKTSLGIFVLLAFFHLLFVNKQWRKYSLLGAFTAGYLLIIALSSFANAERFHLPAVPCILMFAAYGLSLLDKKNIKYVNMWPYAVLCMEVAWAFFKLGSRGLF